MKNSHHYASANHSYAFASTLAKVLRNGLYVRRVALRHGKLDGAGQRQWIVDIWTGWYTSKDYAEGVMHGAFRGAMMVMYG